MREMGRRCVGQEWKGWSMISCRGCGKSTAELLCFNFILKPPSCLGHKLAHPYNSNWLYKFFTPLDCVTVLFFKTCFSCGQQKVNEKEQYSSKCIFWPTADNIAWIYLHKIISGIVLWSYSDSRWWWETASLRGLPAIAQLYYYYCCFCCCCYYLS